MSRSLIILLLIASFPLRIWAQDIVFPDHFRGVQDDVIDHSEYLADIFSRIQAGEPVKIFHIGDSHIRGIVLPQTIQKNLKQYFTADDAPLPITYSYYGVNGAWARRFYRDDMLSMVVDEHPDLVIISFGTNEAQFSGITATYVSETMGHLIDCLHSRVPGAILLLTTPPGSNTRYPSGYDQKPIDGRPFPNRRNKIVSDALCALATERCIAMWNNFEIVGGVDNFGDNWNNSQFMRPDGVHYNATGYRFLADLFTHAFHRAYTDYLASLMPQEPAFDCFNPDGSWTLPDYLIYWNTASPTNP